jgi:ribonuclease T
VLSRAAQAAGLEWDSGEAHSASYDAERTADLFCVVCNQFQPLYEAAAERLRAAAPAADSNPMLEPAPE